MKKTIKKRAFVSAIAMLIVSAIVLTSSTFAWFSMSKEATVEQMDLTVSSPEGIQISANAAAWGANLTNADLFDKNTTSRYKAYEGNVNLMPLNLIPVSCCFADFNSSTGFANFYKAVLNDQKIATVTACNQIADNADICGFVAFDLFFKVASTTTVYFSGSEFTDTSNSDVLTALRVAFQPMGNTQSTVAADAIALKTTTRSDSIIYEPESIKRSADAIASGRAEGKVSTSYLVGTQSGNAVGTDFTLGSGTATPVCALITSDKAASDKSFKLNAGVTKMRVYIWLEGQDIDCRNSVAGATLTAALKFTID